MVRTGRPKRYAAIKLVKLTSEQLADVQGYRDAHDLDSDSEAIRQLIDRGLTVPDEPAEPKPRKRKP